MAEVEFHLALDAFLSAPTEAAHSAQAAKLGHLLTEHGPLSSKGKATDLCT